MRIRSIFTAFCGVSLLALGTAANAEVYRVDALITVCTGTCDSFASLDIGSEITGTITIATAPNTGWDINDIGIFAFEVFNPLAPIEPYDGTNPDTANPLPLDETVTQLGEMAFDQMTGGVTDANNELEGVILFEFIVPPFNNNAAWTIFNIGPAGDLFGQVCLFYDVSGCIPGATEAVNFEGPLRCEDIDINVDPTDLAFGDVAVDSSSMLDVTVENLGECGLTVTDVRVEDSGMETDYDAVHDCGVVPPGGSCTVTVTFTPSAQGLREANLVIDSEDPDEPTVQVPLSGNGVLLPDIALDTLMLDFGQAVVGDTEQLSVTVTNEGNADLDISEVGVTDGLADPFVLVNPQDCTLVLPPAMSCQLDVEFSPTAEGPFADSFTILSDDPDEDTVQVTVMGTAVLAPEPDIDVSATLFDFGVVEIGMSADDTLTVRNVGTATLNIASVTLGGAAAGDYAEDGGCAAAVLDVDASCVITITFGPTAEGARDATLSVASDDPDEPVVDVTLTGTGQAAPAPMIAVSPAALDLGDVAVGGSASGEIDVSNEGTADLVIDSVTGSGESLEEFTLADDCGTLAPAEACTVTVTYAPAAPGEADFSVQIASNDPDSPLLDVPVAATASGDVDGVPDNIEDGAPNGGDGNDDGVLDRDQPNVASLPDLLGSYVTVAAGDGLALQDVSILDNPDPEASPEDFEFRAGGFVGFSVTGLAAGGATSVELIFHDGESADTFFKFGPEPGDASDHFYEFLDDGQTGATLLDDGARVLLALVDGERGDTDLTADGVIVDPGATASAAVAPPPPPPVTPFPGAQPAELIADDGGDCFIATAAYGSYLDPHVVVLRRFRDRVLETSAPGRALVRLYYRYSPPVAEAIRGNELARSGARWTLTPVVYGLAYPGWALLLLASGLALSVARRRGLLAGFQLRFQGGG